MRNVLALIALFVVPALAHADFTEVKYVEPIAFFINASLPPKLKATFPVACDQQFLRVVRYEATDKVTSKVFISIGGFVAQDPMRAGCAGIREVTVDAGQAYSGRDFEVNPIKS